MMNPRVIAATVLLAMLPGVSRAGVEFWFRMDEVYTEYHDGYGLTGGNYLVGDPGAARSGATLMGSFYNGARDNRQATDLPGAGIFDPLTGKTHLNRGTLAHAFPLFGLHATPKAAAISGNGSLSIEAFVNVRQLPDGGPRRVYLGQLFKDSYGAVNAELWIESRKDGKAYLGGSLFGRQLRGSYATSAAPLPFDKWRHVALLYTGSEKGNPRRLKLFLDYEQVADVDATAGDGPWGGYLLPWVDGDFRIGSGYTGGLPGDRWRIDVDEVRVTSGADGVRSAKDFLRTAVAPKSIESTPAKTTAPKGKLPTPPPPTPAAHNLLSNGSFELGLGVEPFYPGWIAASAGEKPPPLAKIDDTIAHGGQRSLKWSALRGKQRGVLEFTVPPVQPTLGHQVTFWTRASRAGVKLIFGLCGQPGHGPQPFEVRLRGEMKTEWTQWSVNLPAWGPYPVPRLEFFSETPDPFDVWIDDVSWTQNPAKTHSRSGPVEIVTLPDVRNGIRFAGQAFRLHWSADARAARKVRLVLKLKDATRSGSETVAWRGEADLSPKPARDTIVLAAPKRGAYLATLEVRDPADDAILAVARERFTVTSDLRGMPPPIDFVCGMHEGLGSLSGGQIEYNWRGHWTLDEFYDMAFQTGFRAQRIYLNWTSLEPRRGEYDWYRDPEIEAAARHGCTTLLTFPPSPLAEGRARLDWLKTPAADREPAAWMFREARDISEFAVSSPFTRFLVDPKQPVLLAPAAESFAKTAETVARRYRGKLTALELVNEANLWMQPRGLLTHYFQPSYAAFKKGDPDLPVLMNQTLDYAADGTGFTDRFFALGALDHCDGFLHHPYSCPTLRDGGWRNMKALEQVMQKHSRANKPVRLGMSELDTMGLHAPLIGHELMQRTLLDASFGALCSAGIVMDGAFFVEGSAPSGFGNRAARAPGTAAVALNALYATLAGHKAAGRADLDEQVLIAFFEKPVSGKASYTVALTVADFPLRAAELRADLKGLVLQAFDQWGELLELAVGDRLPLGREVLYLRSSDRSLFERIRAGRIVWSQRLHGINDDGSVNDIGNYANLAKNVAAGMPVREPLKAERIVAWRTSGPITKSVDALVEAGTLTATGELTKNADWKSVAVQDAGFVLLADKLTPAPAEGTAFFAHTLIHADRTEIVPLFLSTTDPASISINGKLLGSVDGKERRPLGQRWTRIDAPLQKGVNSVLIRLVPRNGPSAFDLRTSEPSTVGIDEKGFVRRWAMIGPWGNPIDSSDKRRGIDVPRPPELHRGDFDFDRLLSGKHGPLLWRMENASEALVRLIEPMEVGFGLAAIESREEATAIVRLTGNADFVLWVNDREALRGEAATASEVTIRLRKGRNVLLVKLASTDNPGVFSLQLSTNENRDLTFRPTPF